MSTHPKETQMADKPETDLLALQMEVRNLRERLGYLEVDCEALRDAHGRLHPDDRLVVPAAAAALLVARG